MILLLDIGNTNTHVGLANGRRVVAHANIPTGELVHGKAGKGIARLLKNRQLKGAAISSVVPRATKPATALIRDRWSVDPILLTAQNVTRIGVNYTAPGRSVPTGSPTPPPSEFITAPLRWSSILEPR